MNLTKTELELLIKLVKCEKCQMSDPTVLRSYKAQLTKLLKKLEGGLK